MKTVINHIKINLIFSLILMIGLSCSENVELHQIPGKYVYNRANYIDTIQILNDGNYVHVHQTTKGTTFKNMGVWKFDTRLREVVFSDFIFNNEQGGEGAGIWISKVKNIEGEIRLIYASEEGLYYKKLK